MRYTVTVLLPLLLVFGACSGSISFDAPLYFAPQWGSQFGGSPNRVQMRESSLRAPLKLNWKYSLSTGVSAPAIIASENHLFIPTVTGTVYILQKSTGSECGEINLKGYITGTPAAKESLLYVPLESTTIAVAAINLNDATIRWAKDVEPSGSPILVDEDRVVLTTGAGGVFCYPLEDTTTLWSARLPKFPLTAATAAQGNIVVGCPDGCVYAFNRLNGERQWKYQTSGAILAAPISVDSLLFVASQDRCIYALNASSGSLLWKRELDAPLYASPMAQDKELFVGSSGGRVFALDMESGNTLWTFDAESAIGVQPAVSESLVFICSLNKKLYALDRQQGTLVWSYETDDQLRTAPLLSGNNLYVVTQNGDVYSFSSEEER